MEHKDSNRQLRLIGSRKFYLSFTCEMHKLQQASAYTDFTLMAQGRAIECHKVVLAAASPYFDALFRSNMKETKSAELNLDHIKCDILDELIFYCYTGNIADIGYSSMTELVEAAIYFQLSELKSKCEDYLKQELTPLNCLHWHRIGKLYGLDNLVNAASNMMQNSFTEVIESKTFTELSCEELVEYISSDIHASRDAVLSACVEWIRIDVGERKRHIQTLLLHVELLKCSREFLQRFMKNYDDILSEDDVNAMYKIIADCFLSPELSSVSNSLEKNLLLWGWQDNKFYCMLNVCRLKDFDWEQVRTEGNQPNNLYQSCCHIGNNLLVTGGRVRDIYGSENNEDELYKPKCYLYVVKYNIWHELPDMPDARGHHSSVAVGEYAYIIGGQLSTGFNTQKVDVLDVERKRWTTVRPMIHAVGKSPICVQCNDCIYVIKNDINFEVSSIQVYDTLKNKCSMGPPLPDSITCTEGATAASLKDSIFLVGGYGRLCSRLCTVTQTWVNLSPPPPDLFAVVVDGRKLLALGKYDNDEDCEHDCYVSEVGLHEYDTDQNTWKIMNVMCPYFFNQVQAFTIYKAH